MSIQGGTASSTPRQSRANSYHRVIPQDLRDPHIEANDLCASSHTPLRSRARRSALAARGPASLNEFPMNSRVLFYIFVHFRLPPPVHGAAGSWATAQRLSKFVHTGPTS